MIYIPVELSEYDRVDIIDDIIYIYHNYALNELIEVTAIYTSHDYITKQYNTILYEEINYFDNDLFINQNEYKNNYLDSLLIFVIYFIFIIYFPFKIFSLIFRKGNR